MPVPTESDRLLAYVADLELEVDRLRRQTGFLRQEFGEGLRHVAAYCNGVTGDEPLRAAAEGAVQGLLGALRDLREAPAYHPAYDQVIAIAVRPLVEKVFRWQQLMTGRRNVSLRLDLAADYVEWFPARLRNILENLFSNALRYRDPVATGSWVGVAARAADEVYEVRVTGSGPGLPSEDGGREFALLSRAAPVRESGLGVGLSVARLLIEHSGGTLAVVSEPGGGAEYLVTLPRYELDDFLT